MNAFCYFFRCFHCRRTSKLKKIKGAKRDVQLTKGEDMLFRDLDIVNLLEMIKDYKLMKQVLFSQDDRVFLQLQQRDMICTSSSDDEDNEAELKAKRSMLRTT